LRQSQLFGRKIEGLLLGRGIEESDPEPRHLQAELRRIESGFVSDVGQLNPLAGVSGQSLADLLGATNSSRTSVSHSYRS
jgi:hypothetical protein